VISLMNCAIIFEPREYFIISLSNVMAKHITYF
jgi:hypothetical protein